METARQRLLYLTSRSKARDITHLLILIAKSSLLFLIGSKVHQVIGSTYY
uniref:Uncharacterized protein n=1 Tax=Brassica campestris TaxID=3711 RepID=A0A3P5Y047_BRACM|nr:unnamed protein product [Brassica rapa]